MTRAVKRRQFLKSSAAAASALAVPGVLWSKSPNEKLGIGGIGVGGKGWSDINACATSEEIVALCDVDETHLLRAAKKYPRAATCHDFRELLDRKDVDAVTVSTPDHCHAVASMMAMKLGKHVYCQKPLTHSVYEARQLARTAKEYGVATQMGNQGHSSPRMRRLVELVMAGAIGRVHEAHAWSNRPIWPQGIGRPVDTPPVPDRLHWDLWLGPAPARPYHPAYHPFKWRGWWDFGTGALGDMGCHIIDSIFWALSLGAPSSVRVEGPEPNEETAPKWSRVHYEFPARGAHPPVRLTWHDGGKKPPPELFGVSDSSEIPGNGTIMVGEKGSILNPRGFPILLPRENFKDYEQPEPFLRQSPGHYKEWIEAAKTGSPTGTHFGYASRLAELVLLGNVAYRVGRKIEWDSENLRATNAPEADQYIRREYRKGWEL